MEMNQTLAVGNAIIIRTVTYHYTGKVVAVDAAWITLRDAAWVADSGRWGNALKTGELSEVEPYLDGEILVGVGGIVDISPWCHPLPRVAK